VYGAADPNSGTAALIEVARGLGRLYTDHNWRPLRSIYLLSWSGEEYGLLGSTGWAELNPSIMKRALVYLNTDTVVSGDYLTVSASPSLITLWKQVMRDLNETARNDNITTQPKTGYSYFANPPYGEIHDVNTDWELKMGSDKDDWKIGVLGSGSDYTVFLDHFGVPSIDFSFGQRSGQYGQYHSIYDSFSWMNRYGGRDGDIGSAFDYMALAAKIWGLLAMRMATTDIVPLDHIMQGQALTQYVSHIDEQVKEKGYSIDLQNLTKAVEHFQQAVAKVQLQCKAKAGFIERSRETSDILTDGNDVDQCNEKIAMTERQFLLDTGLPDRPWFKHVLQAPGMDLGYAAEAFPGIQQALNDGNFDLAQDQVILTAARVNAAALRLEGGKHRG
jgi:N-acetylated-alpha-linked acidic dipeptidase